MGCIRIGSSSADGIKTMKILIVFGGCYSNTQVVGVFDEERRSEAEILSALIDDGHIEEYELNATAPSDPGKDFFTVEMDREGHVVSHEKRSRLDSTGGTQVGCCFFETYMDYGGRKSYWRIEWYGYADSLEHAVKIVNEHRTRMIASGEWALDRAKTS